MKHYKNMLQKHLESLAVIFHLCTIFFMPILGPIIVLYCLYVGSYARYFTIAYLIIMYYDREARNKGDYMWTVFQGSKYIKLILSYFSMSIEAEVEIPQNKNYIVGYHPHGVILFGLFAHLSQQCKNFQKVFGNGKTACCTAPYNLEIPIQRDYFSLLKGIKATEECILNWLSKKDVSHYALLSVGGPEEALLASPGVHTVILKKRLGFCRLAIKSGANLIPVYVFGENSLWDTVKVEKNSFLHKIQMFIYKNFNIGLPLMKGKIKYHYMFVFPKRGPLTLVFGKPIEVKQCDNPTRAQISELHGRYCEALKQLFDSNKAKYLDDKNAELIIQ